MLLPTLNTLQRGQVGLLVAYLVLLGFRLAIGADRGPDTCWAEWCLRLPLQ